MPLPTVTFETFQQELAQLVSRFDRDHVRYTSDDYNEATLRLEFLDPFFRALGWDVGNAKGLIHTEREVDIEVRTIVSGRQKRADYVFRISRVERFTCEAKKPSEALHARHIYQAKRDAYARGIPIAVLSDFAELKIYVVGARPRLDESQVGEYKVFNFPQYPAAARELWELLAYENVAAGSLDKLIDGLPKRALKVRGRQGYLIKPDHTRSLDADFLNFLDEARRELGSDLLKHNARADLLEGHKLNEAAQRILDRLVFLRICEDRSIDTGELLASILDHWYRQQEKPLRLRRQTGQGRLAGIDAFAGGGTVGEDAGAYYGAARPAPPAEGGLYRAIASHFRTLDQRPPSYKPFFNGQLFKPHFSEDLIVGDEWLANFIDDLTADDNGYNFADIKVEILGAAYERFLGKILLPAGRGVKIEDKPEVRKAGGVYYTPRYIVDYIVEQTVGRQLEGKPPAEVSKLRFLDPACGSGSFLVRVYERVMEHYLRYYTNNPGKRHATDCYVDAAGNVRLTTQLKQSILLNNVHGVDIDMQAVEVSQLSLYLKMLEGENRESLYLQADMLKKAPLLPPLDQNIRCGNSLIASDFSLDPAELVRVNAFDWDIGFEKIMATGGFDAVVGNPPWMMAGYYQPHDVDYLKKHYATATGKFDLYYCFVEKAHSLLSPAGYFGMIIPNKFLHTKAAASLRGTLSKSGALKLLLDFGDSQLFADATNYSSILITSNIKSKNFEYKKMTADMTPLETAKIAHDSLPPGAPWNLGRDDYHQLFEKITKRSTPLDSLTSRFGTGCQTGSDKVLTIKKEHAGNFEPPLLKTIFRGRDVKRYALGDDARLAIFPYSSDGGAFRVMAEPQLRKHRKTYAHLLANKRKLDKRVWFGQNAESLSGAWYGYVYMDKESSFKQPHILTPSLSNKANFTMGNGSLFLTGTAGVTSIIPKQDTKEDIHYILGLLNSRLLNSYMLRHSPAFRGGFYKFSAPYLKKIPIRQVDFSKNEETKIHDQIATLARQLLALVPKLRTATLEIERATLQNAIRKADRDIDQLVYQLYGLTEEEIAIIEQAGDRAV